MDEIKEKIDILTEKIDSLTSTRKSKKLEPNFGPCNWVSNEDKKCTYKAQSSGFCNKHTLLIESYTANELDVCNTSKETKFEPVSLTQMEQVLGETPYSVEVYADGDRFEGSVSDEGIEVNSVMYFFEPKKNCKRTKSLRVIKTTLCNNQSLIKFNEKFYCKECFSVLKSAPKSEIVVLKGSFARALEKSTAS